MSDHTVVCTITNCTNGTISRGESRYNSGTSLSLPSDPSIAPGATVQVFKASGSTFQGCGGQVTFKLPNGYDLLVLDYNTSTHHDNAYCFVQLRGNTYPGCSEYWCKVSGTVKSGSDSLTPSITVCTTSDPNCDCTSAGEGARS